MSTVDVRSKNSNESAPRELSRTERSYHELPGLQRETKDVLKQLDANIRLLEDVGGRLGFMLAEVRSLIR